MATVGARFDSPAESREDHGGERMSPEELAEARHYATCYQAGYVHDLMHNFLAHVDQQAARIKELDDAVSGPLENIALC